MKLLVINGPNINMLGLREPQIYGAGTYEELTRLIRQWGNEQGYEVELYQSNSEGAIVDTIQNAYGRVDGIVINPAAYTHTSIAIPDAIKAVSIPAVEVHISDIRTRELYRQISYTSEACIKTIAGEGFEGYKEAIAVLKEHVETGTGEE